MFARQEIDAFLDETPTACGRTMRWEFWFRHPDLERLEGLRSSLVGIGFDNIEIRGILDETDPDKEQYMVCEVLEEHDRDSLWRRSQQFESLASSDGVVFDGFDVSNVDESPLR